MLVNVNIAGYFRCIRVSEGTQLFGLGRSPGLFARISGAGLFKKNVRALFPASNLQIQIKNKKTTHFGG
jgi:hypothetical protein